MTTVPSCSSHLAVFAFWQAETAHEEETEPRLSWPITLLHFAYIYTQRESDEFCFVFLAALGRHVPTATVVNGPDGPLRSTEGKTKRKN